MKLIVHELRDTVKQVIMTGPRVVQLTSIRAHIYRHGAPAGTVRIRLEDENGILVAQTDAVSAAAFGSGTYWHGYRRMPLSAHLRPLTRYVLSLVPVTGYAFSNAAYLGWCNDFDLRRNNASYEPNTGFQAPLDFELWSRKTLAKGRY